MPHFWKLFPRTIKGLLKYYTTKQNEKVTSKFLTQIKKYFLIFFLWKSWYSNFYLKILTVLFLVNTEWVAWCFSVGFCYYVLDKYYLLLMGNCRYSSMEWGRRWCRRKKLILNLQKILRSIKKKCKINTQVLFL